MSLPRQSPSAQPDPDLAARFESPPGVPREVRRQAEFFVFFGRTIFPLLGLKLPEVLYADGAYISSEALAQAQEEGRELMGPAPAAPDRGTKVFTVEAFDVTVEERSAVCPASQRNLYCRLETRSSGRVEYRFEWNRSLCESCPLNSQCVSAGQNHRTILVGERHTLLQAPPPSNADRRVQTGDAPT